MNISHYSKAFVERGFVTLDLSEELADWVATTKANADAWLQEQPPNLECRHNEGKFPVQAFPLPRDLEVLLNDLLVDWNGHLGECAQLSTLVNGFDKGSEDHGRHVDGAYEGLAWAGVLVGIFLQFIPKRDAGNLVVWPATHRETQGRFSSLGNEPDVCDVRRAIRSHSSCGHHEVVSGPAGTVVVMDHRLEHGMVPHRVANLTRHVVYFRLPKFTNCPVEVVNRHHFLKHG